MFCFWCLCGAPLNEERDVNEKDECQESNKVMRAVRNSKTLRFAIHKIQQLNEHAALEKLFLILILFGCLSVQLFLLPNELIA